MQKKVLCIITLVTMPLVAMEKTKIFLPELTYYSPEITRVHTQEYLQDLVKRKHYSPLLDLVDRHIVNAVLKATNDVIQAKKKSIFQPHYSLSVIPQHYYGAGNALPRVFGDTYAVIPIAVAHALQSNLCKRILIIDEIFNRTKDADDEEDDDDDYDDVEHYYSKGNGSLFYPDKDSKLFNLFNGKIITSDKIKQNIDTFLETDGKDIDLIFYSFDMRGDALNSDNYISILKKYIPTIFILVDCPKEKERVAIQHISNDILNQSKLPFYKFDVHYYSHTETQIVQNLEITTAS
jgi:hypothetical protein